MSKFIVAGLTQIETIVKVNKIPIQYAPFLSLKDAIQTAAGGDAFNISLALKWLGNDVEFMTVVGKLQNLGIFNPPDRRVSLSTDYVLPIMKETPTEVLIFDKQRRQQKFEDLKDIRDAEYDMTLLEPIINDCDMVFLSNANFCRSFIPYVKDYNKKLAVKIHQFEVEKEIYNEDFLKNADILYFSDNTIEDDPFEFIKSTAAKYDPDIIILGQEAGGLILYDRDREINVHFDPVKSVAVVNNAGSGNATFACFLHYYLKSKDSVDAIRKALIFASHKIGFLGTSYGFMTEEQLAQWENLIYNPRDVSRWI